MIVVGYGDAHAALRRQDDIGAGGGLLSDEVVAGARVEEGKEQGAADGDAELHRLPCANTGDGEHQDDGCSGRIVGGVVVFGLGEVDEKEALANAIVVAPKLLITIKTKS